MAPLLTYYTSNVVPNDEELKACIDIANKFKDNVMLLFGEEHPRILLNCKCLFIEPGDTMDKLQEKIKYMKSSFIVLD